MLKKSRHAAAVARVQSGPAYVVAVVSSLCALGASLVVGAAGTNVSSLLFLGAVAISGWYGGFGPALVATALGFLALDYFFETPAYSLAIDDIHTILDTLAYVFIALLLGSLNAQLRRARMRSEVARSEAQAAVRARDEALASVSHDMRTPLTAIQASVAALQDGETSMSPDLRAGLLHNIATESQRLEHFIVDALALSRIEAGIQPHLTVNAPGEVVSAILDRRMSLLAGREIHFDVPDTLPLIRFDANMLEQALGNVLDNVAMHTPAGTGVAITGRMDKAGPLLLEIADSGPGIPDDARERIFGKFERLQDRGPGAGLGLALARAAIQAQGGQLWVESSASGGACFVLCLPGVSSRSD